MRKVIFIILVGMLITLTAASAQAHMLWLNVSHYTPSPGDNVWIEIGWGHKNYPRDLAMSDKWLERVYVIDPQGQQVVVQEIFPAFYRFTPTTKGNYQVVAKIKPGFLSITTAGHKLGSKKDLTDVVSCFQYVMNATAVIEVGGTLNVFSRKSNEPLEILPLKSPASLRVGDTLPVRIMFRGKPIAGAKVQGTYVGYQTDEKNHWAVEEESDSRGIVLVKLTSKGQWMFKTGHKIPYPDKAEADEHSYSTSLTVGL